MNDHQKCVLIIDDDQEILEAVEFALQHEGYLVLTAHDGCEGLARIECDRPDLVVLDLVMPRRNGFGLLDQLHRPYGRGPRIIMTSGNAEQKNREIAQSKGVDLFISKPFDINELLESVASLLAAG